MRLNRSENLHVGQWIYVTTLGHDFLFRRKVHFCRRICRLQVLQCGFAARKRLVQCRHSFACFQDGRDGLRQLCVGGGHGSFRRSNLLGKIIHLGLLQIEGGYLLRMRCLGLSHICLGGLDRGWGVGLFLFRSKVSLGLFHIRQSSIHCRLCSHLFFQFGGVLGG